MNGLVFTDSGDNYFVEMVLVIRVLKTIVACRRVLSIVIDAHVFNRLLRSLLWRRRNRRGNLAFSQVQNMNKMVVLSLGIFVSPYYL
jgi:hypothetical protein